MEIMIRQYRQNDLPDMIEIWNEVVFNAVVKTNHSARHIYEKLGFIQLGIIPKGFLLKTGKYEDIVLYYHEL